jgi:hypothetical protein
MPPSEPPISFDEDVRTFVSSYSCYPNNLEPSEACPLDFGGQVITSNYLNVEWFLGETIPGPGTYTLFRLALQQQPGNGPLTLEDTGEPVAMVSGQVVFHLTGPVSVEYIVYRHPPDYCACQGDVNWDGRRDGRDVSNFMDCLLEGGLGCTCADMNGNGVVTTADVAQFVDKLLTGDECT